MRLKCYTLKSLNLHWFYFQMCQAPSIEEFSPSILLQLLSCSCITGDVKKKMRGIKDVRFVCIVSRHFPGTDLNLPVVHNSRVASCTLLDEKVSMLLDCQSYNMAKVKDSFQP